MLRLEYDKKQIEEVIDKIVRKTMNMDLTWDWPCGVAYYGISEAYEKTGKEEYLNLLKDRVDELIDLGLPRVWTVNACAMGHCLITLYKATDDKKYYDILTSFGLRTMCCSIRCLPITIFRSRHGAIPCLWLHSCCCGWGL